MKIFNDNLNVNFNSLFYNKKQDTDLNCRTRDLPPDSIELHNNWNNRDNWLTKLKRILHHNKNIKEYDPQKDMLTLTKLEQSQSQPHYSEFKHIKDTSNLLLEEGNDIIDDIQCNNIEDIEGNTKFYKLQYKGDEYISIAKSDENGFLKKIFHAKNGNVEAIYDIKTPIKSAEKFSLDNKIIADCYFYSPGDKVSQKIEYMKNIKHYAKYFNSIYDVENGGVRKVKQNIDNSPIELYLIINDEQSMQYLYNYKKNK